PLLYFSLFHLPVDGGIMITGSHNPPEYNGFKVTRGQETLTGEDLQEIQRLIEQGAFVHGEGELSQADVITPYLRLVQEKIHLGRRLHVVIDCGNGTAGVLAPTLIRELGCQVTELYCEPDGHFPHHHPDPTVPENLRDLIQTVREQEADVGLAYDGDADRLGAVDDRGNIVWGDQLMVLFARDILSRHPGASIIFDVKCSQNLVQEIVARGGKPIMWKTGHSLIKKKLRETQAALAGEMSGHLFFADDYFGYDDAIYASCRLLQFLSHTDQPLSALLESLPRTYSTPEIRADCPEEQKFEVVKALQEYFSSRYEVIDIDGVRINFGYGWGLIRASNTQPVIVLRFEADTPEHLREIRQRIENKLREFPAVRLPSD
ncbi:MAG: phosphomannomutase/phosphoglucomutase, partial [Nitrospinota bacterium]